MHKISFLELNKRKHLDIVSPKKFYKSKKKIAKFVNRQT